MPNFNIVGAKDAVYAINAYQAINGLQRFNYRYTAREQDHDEIGNPLHVATSFEPETSGSFEVKDTATLAPLFARMRYNYATQSYSAGHAANLTTNAGINITEDDLQYMVFDLVEQKKPGATFSEAKLIPNVFLTRFSLRLNNDGAGTASFDWQGNLMIPVYKPYHSVQSYPFTRTTASTITVNAGWSVNSGTFGILGGMINNNQLATADLAWSGATVITIQASGLAKIGGSATADDRIMVWLFNKSPSTSVPIDYVNTIKFVKADRIDIWLLPSGTATSDANRLLRVQSVDLSGEVPRDELKEILRNETKTSTFFWAPKYPLNFTGTVNILETTLHKYAELQGKTLNESATTSSVDANNVLDVTSWIDAKIVVQWYKYGSSSPIQRFTLSNVTITGYEGTMAVGGNLEAVWSLKSDGDWLLEGLAD